MPGLSDSGEQMTRDMDLIRTILLKVEADPRFNGSFHSVRAATLGITDHTDAEVIYHLVMLVDAGFLIGNTRLASLGDIVVSKLTWQGHEFLDSVRDPAIWAKTKNGATAAGGFTVDLLKDLAKGFLKKQIEERTGVKL
jgi:hypothetical protein